MLTSRSLINHGRRKNEKSSALLSSCAKSKGKRGTNELQQLHERNLLPKLFRKISKMKKKSTELDVDFIGGQGQLTKAEEQAISEFIKAKKLEKAKKQIRKTKPMHK